MSHQQERTVLVVEDDEATAQLERRALLRSGFNVAVAPTIAAAREQILSTHFIAIVLDYHLPDGEPWSIVDLARACVPRIPVILVTALGNEQVVTEALHRGVGDYVRKSPDFIARLGDTVGRVASLASAEEKLRQSGALFQMIADHGDDMIMTFDPSGIIRYVSATSRRVLGREMTDLVGLGIGQLLHPDDVPDLLLRTDPDRGDTTIRRETFRCRHRDGHYVWVETNLQRVRDPQSGEFTEIIATTRDITARMAAKQKTEAALREKTVLLNEVHHRVKNNLQIIISLLMLQREQHADGVVQTVLAESVARVRAMALIHQFLYERRNFARLDLVAYLRELGSLINSVHSGAERGIELSVGSADVAVWLPFEQAVPCGLLVNELLSNAFKHGFKDGRQGSIDLDVFVSDDEIQITIADNGIGLPGGFNIRKSPTLGLQLAAILVEQLHGRWRIESSTPGARFEVFFPAPLPGRVVP